MATPAIYEVREVAKTTEVKNVDSVVVTEVEADQVNGGYVREIRVLGYAAGATTSAVVLTLVLRADNADAIHIATPAQEF